MSSSDFFVCVNSSSVLLAADSAIPFICNNNNKWLVSNKERKNPLFTHLRVNLVDDPLQPLSSLAGIRTDAGRQYVLHVVAQRHTLHRDGGLLPQQRLARIGGMRLVEHGLVDADKVIEGHVDRLQGHLLDGRIYRGGFTGKAHLCSANDLEGVREGWKSTKEN